MSLIFADWSSRLLRENSLLFWSSKVYKALGKYLPDYSFLWTWPPNIHVLYFVQRNRNQSSVSVHNIFYQDLYPTVGKKRHTWWFMIKRNEYHSWKLQLVGDTLVHLWSHSNQDSRASFSTSTVCHAVLGRSEFNSV